MQESELDSEIAVIMRMCIDNHKRQPARVPGLDETDQPKMQGQKPTLRTTLLSRDRAR